MPSSLLKGVTSRYLNTLGFNSQLFNIDAELIPDDNGFNLLIEINSDIIYSALFDLGALMLLSKAADLFPCNEVIIAMKGSAKAPLRLQVKSLEMLNAQVSKPNLRNYQVPEPKFDYCKSPDLSPQQSIPLDMRRIAETAYDLDASLWIIDFDGTYRYYQPRKNSNSIQSIHSIIGRKIEDQEIPADIKRKTAWNHSLAIETRKTVVDSYISPCTGEEIVTKTRPCFEHETCFVFSMPRFQDNLK